MPNQINEADFIQTQTLIGQTYSLQRVPEVGAAWGRERHLLASSQSMYSVSESTLSIFNFFKHIWATTNFTFSLTWEKLECKCKKAKKKHWKIWEIRRKEYEKEWCEIGRWRSLVRCSTLKEAELIPDSAVPYTLPESRWNSSNRQNVKRGGGGGAHTAYDMCEKTEHSRRWNRSGSVREAESQLVSQRRERAAQICTSVCVRVCFWVCEQSVLLPQTAGRGGEKRRESQRVWRVQPAVWLLNSDRTIPQDGGERDGTLIQVWHAVRKQSNARVPCPCLCLSVSKFEETFWPVYPVFFTKFIRKMWQLKCVCAF